MIELDDLQDDLAEQGFADRVGDWGTAIEWDEYEQFGPEVVGIVCGGDTDGDSHDSTDALSVGVFAVDLPDESDVADLYELVGGDSLIPEDEPLLGGTVSSGCSHDGAEHVCIAAWSVDSFVIGLHLWSSEQQVDTGSTSAVLRDMLADGISNLATLAVPSA